MFHYLITGGSHRTHKNGDDVERSHCSEDLEVALQAAECACQVPEGHQVYLKSKLDHPKAQHMAMAQNYQPPIAGWFSDTKHDQKSMGHGWYPNFDP